MNPFTKLCLQYIAIGAAFAVGQMASEKVWKDLLHLAVKN